MLTPVTHILPLTTIRRERLLPVPGKVFVRMGQRVKPTDVIAEVNLFPRHILLDVARGLGVSRERADQLIQRRPGEGMVEGDVIASRSGLARRVIRAPATGRVVMVGEGQVLLEAEGEPYQVIAGLPGTVVEQVGEHGAVVETTGALVQGVWGNGRIDFGVMRAVAQAPEDILTPDRLDVRMRGSIILAGHCNQEETLKSAAELALRGLILGSMEARLLSGATRLRFPVILLEGFGHRPINPVTFKLLSTNDNREVSINAEVLDRYAGTRPEVIIPLPAPSPPALAQDILEISPGQVVRILREPHAGEIGSIAVLRPGMMKFPSGVRAPSARIMLEGGGTAMVPLANLEILQ